MSPAKKKTPKSLVELPPKDLTAAPVKATTEQKSVAASAVSAISKMVKQRPIEVQDGVRPHLSTGSTILDTLISGASVTEEGHLVCPGYPRRRIVEIYGPESSGKTTVALSAVANTQRVGGVAMYLDTEHALDHRYARSCGVKFNESLLLYEPDTMEQCFKMILIGLISAVDLIVVDSVASLVPAKELEKGLDDEAKIGVVAQKMAQTLPKFALWLAKYPQDQKGKTREDHPGTTIVLLNQERSKIDTSGGKGRRGGGDSDPNTTGGKALKFYTYLRLRFQKVQVEKIKRKSPATGVEKEYPYGTITRVKIVKTKVVGNQGDDALFFIRYGFGVDDLYSLIEVGARGTAVEKEGSYYAFEGERFQGRDKLRACLLANPDMAERLRQLVIKQLMGNAAQPIRDEDLSPQDQVVALAQSEMKDDDDDEPNEEEIEAEDAVLGDDDGVSDD